jgi:uncharacterized membrane protein
MPHDDDTHELRIQALETRLAAVERALADARPAAAATEPPPMPLLHTAAPLLTPPPPPVVAAAAAPAPTAVAPPRREIDFEELLTGKLFAWIGGIAILVGVLFFVATAIHRGWLPIELRVALAFLGSTALLCAGVWLHEQHGRTQASLVATGAAVAALYASLVAATSLYDLVAPTTGLGVALLIGAVATGVAIRFDSPEVAGLGIVGCVLSPVLVDAGTSPRALAFMGIALSSSTAVLLWRRWDWLALAAYVASAPQLAAWVLDHRHHGGAAIPVILAFWLLYLVAALGYEVRVPTTKLRASGAALTLSNVVLTTGLGWLVLHDSGMGHAATSWVIAMAIGHIGIGAAVAIRLDETPEVPLLLVACGVALSAIALALALDGPALVSGWAVEAVVLMWISRRLDSRRAFVGAFGFLVLAAGLAVRAALEGGLGSGTNMAERVTGLVVVALAVAACAELFSTEDEQLEQVRDAMRGVAATLLLLALPIAFDGLALAAAFGLGALALAALARARHLDVLALAAASWAVASLAHVLIFEATLRESLLSGAGGSGLVAVLLVVAVWAGITVLIRPAVAEEYAQALVCAAAVVALWGLSALVVAAVPAGGGSTDGKQLALSALWGIVGVALLLTGLARVERPLRLGGLALLSLAIGKVFLFDLAKLGSLPRVGSFVALGVLLLGAAYAYQRQAARERE